VQLHRSVERGRRRALQHQDHPSGAQRPGRPAGPQPAGRSRVRAGADLRPHRHRHRQLPEPTFAVRVQEHEVGVQRRQGQPGPRAGRLEEGLGRHPGQGRQEAEVRLPDLDQCPAAEDPGHRQAGGGEGRHRAGAQVGDGLGVLLVGRGQPRHLHPLLHRHPDVHDHHDAAGPRAVHAPVPDRGDRLQGQQVAGPQHHPLAKRGVRQALQGGRVRARSGQAGSALHPDERIGHPERRGHPGGVPSPRGRRRQHAARGAERLGLRLLEPAELVPRGRDGAPADPAPRARVRPPQPR
jgi:hypothetical protein